MNQKNINLVLLAFALIIIGIISRLSAHAWNLTLIGGLALFSGAFFVRKTVAFAIVILSLLISDAIIGFHNQMIAVYFAFSVMCFVGSFLSLQTSRASVILSAVVASLLFFLITNFSVWFEGSLYPQTFEGMVNCFVMGVPFCRGQFAGDVISTIAFFEIAKAFRGLMVARFEPSQIKLF